MSELRTEPIPLCEWKPDSNAQENKQDEVSRMNLAQKNLSSIESIHAPIASLTHTVNSAVAAFSLLLDNGEGFAQRLSGSDKKEQFREYFLKMRKDYDEVAIISQSIAEITVLGAKRVNMNALTEIDVTQSTKNSPR